ncbi:MULTISPECIES: glycosyltransferase family 4 protein [unclassified Acidovorax]|uniref:glycosyltransferase family 4 protein n=1 Tax=unclassified Acidovorax TaxID=2684926 RepID=UPI0018DF2DBE|nr:MULTISPECIES: glycosyltransferase family 4 protein [unclassified Acidovorax]
MMKVFHLNHSDINGGAARAAYRIHHALRNHNVNSRMLVNSTKAGDWTVDGPKSKIAKAVALIRSPLASLLTKTLKTENSIIHSPAIVPSRWSNNLNSSNADVIHLHWINSEMMSISDIGNIKKPVVWTLHDMWAFCGAEHVTTDYRWRDGYTARNRPSHEAGFDLNRWTATRKLKHWKRPMHIVTPSRWLADCAKESVLMRDWPITVIPNAIDTDTWQPVDKALARSLLQLPPDVPLLLFGAWGGTGDAHKGFDLLQSALNHLRGQLPGLELVIFGQLAPQESVDMGFPVHYTGHLHDDVSMRLLYSAADVMVIPSRIDNLPNTGVEAHACGTPVVAFDACGLPDIVVHQQTGYLAKPYSTDDLARGIEWVLSKRDTHHATISINARKRAVDLWSSSIVAKQYMNLYGSIAFGR